MESDAPVIHCVGVIRADRKSAIKAGQRFVTTREAVERDATVVVSSCTAGIDGDGLADEVDGGLRLAELKRSDTQEMQSIEVPGLHLQNLPVQTLGTLQLPLLVERDSTLQLCRDGCR